LVPYFNQQSPHHRWTVKAEECHSTIFWAEIPLYFSCNVLPDELAFIEFESGHCLDSFEFEVWPYPQFINLTIHFNQLFFNHYDDD